MKTLVTGAGGQVGLDLIRQLLAEGDIHSGDYNIHWLEKWLDKALPT